VSLLTDFGLRDPSPAILHGVILGIAPEARIVDVSHEVEKFAIRDGAFLLSLALPYLPVGVHVGVVDPGVGTDRRPIAIRVARGDVLVGPDNGLLLPATAGLGGIEAVRLLAEPRLMRPEISRSFHGRDIFAPVAAHLAASGAGFEDVGPPIDPGDLVELAFARPEIAARELRTSVVYVDTFGNVKLGATPGDLAAAIGPLRDGRRLAIRLADGSAATSIAWHDTFGLAGEGDALLYEDSYGRLCLAINRGAAATRFDLRLDDPIEIGG
jgi:hypothetical protein